jgi:hypothetical protein
MSGEGRVRELLGRLREETSALTQDELRAAARSATRKPRTLSRAMRQYDGATLGRRSAVVAVAAALLIGSGLGFGLGSSVTPTGSAGTNLVGFGFVPAKGWTVTQADLASPGAARAIATNVRLHQDDRLGAVPRYTLESLPAHGVLIVATFTPRGDPERDFRFAEPELPLSITSAEGVPERELHHPRLAQYRIEAGVGAYNLRADVYLGTPQLLATAQGQLNRLVVASERVTIFARPNVVRDLSGTTLYGSVESRRAGEGVTIQAKDCRQPSFRVVHGATTTEGGGWSTPFYPQITTTVRAVWKDSTSTPITVRQGALVSLSKHFGGELRVFVRGRTSFWRKRVRIERFDARLGRWQLARSVLLTRSGGARGQGPQTGTASSWASFKPKLPKGTLVRAVFPLSQARPCYLAGTSRAVRL